MTEIFNRSLFSECEWFLKMKPSRDRIGSRKFQIPNFKFQTWKSPGPLCKNTDRYGTPFGTLVLGAWCLFRENSKFQIPNSKHGKARVRYVKPQTVGVPRLEHWCLELGAWFGKIPNHKFQIPNKVTPGS